MKIAVCDDEKNIRDEIIKLIRELIPKAEISTFSSPEEMLAFREDFDVSFLDISMGTDLTGIELARILRQRQEQHGKSKGIIIFVTGFSEYMQDAFDVNAWHYLIKPIDHAKFREVFLRAEKEIQTLEQNSQRHIMVKTAGTSRKVYLNDIRYIESSNKKVVFHTARENFEAYMKMDDLERELGGSFYRCHRCYLVNMGMISAYSADTIRMVSGEKLLLAQKKYPDFVKTFMRYAKRGGTVNV